MIRSPLRYPGGKSRAVEKIAALVLPFEEFREPLVGGGSLFIHLKQKVSLRQFWINDKYSGLATFWKVLQSDSENLIGQIRRWKSGFSDGKKLFYFLRKNIDSFDENEVAAAFFVFNRITFSGTTEAGGFSIQAFEKRFTESSIERLEKMPEILRGVKITDDDYSSTLNFPGKDVFVFLDPPYFSARNSALYGKNGNLHKTFDHERLAENLKNCPHRWLLTYDDSPFIRQLYSFANVTDWDLTYGMRNVSPQSNQKATELFISNYELKSSEQKQVALAYSK